MTDQTFFVKFNIYFCCFCINKCYKNDAAVQLGPLFYLRWLVGLGHSVDTLGRVGSSRVMKNGSTDDSDAM